MKQKGEDEEALISHGGAWAASVIIRLRRKPFYGCFLSQNRRGTKVAKQVSTQK
jgi:hypothetical protein